MAIIQDLERVARMVQARLDTLIEPEPGASGLARLIEAMRYAALGGGKRLRPFLLIEAARLFGLNACIATPWSTTIFRPWMTTK
jgi:geranylgeranyl pyrophosphate synthase